MRTDPRIRQSLNRISDNVESATESACVGCFTFSKTYLEPLWNTISNGCAQLCSCLSEDPHLLVGGQGRNGGRGRNRGRSEFPFNFYNDDNWYDDYYGPADGADGFLGSWGNDELDRLLAGNGPRRNEEMYYGIAGGGGVHHNNAGATSSGALGLFAGRRRRSAVPPHDGGPDPTVIPNTSMLGFLTRWPFWRSTLRYRPSAADLQEHPGMPRDFPNYSDDDAGNNGVTAVGDGGRATRGRKRSSTGTSGLSADSGESFRSRGDLFPSDGEEDAIPIGDEFSIALRGPGSDCEASTRGTQRDSMLSSSPRSIGVLSNRNSTLGEGIYTSMGDPTSEVGNTLDDEELKKQEEDITAQEEREVERRRAAAQRLAIQRGLSIDNSGSMTPLNARLSSLSAPALERTQSLPPAQIPRSPVLPSSVPRSPVSAIYIPSAPGGPALQPPSSLLIAAPTPISPIHNILREEIDVSLLTKSEVSVEQALEEHLSINEDGTPLKTGGSEGALHSTIRTGFDKEPGPPALHLNSATQVLPGEE